MNKQIPKHIQNDIVALTQLLTLYFHDISSGKLAPIQVAGAEKRSTRRFFLNIIAISIFISLLGSITIFLFTRSNMAFIPLTFIVGLVSPFIREIVKCLFWGPENYKLEELRQLCNVRKCELKYQVKKA
jgi:hypothetical protein